MKKVISIILICCLYLLLVGSVFTFVDIRVNNVVYDDTSLDTEIIEPLIPMGKTIIDNYKNEYNNDDVVGEINIINTNYRKAIMQSSDNEYYLNHLEDGTSNYMGSIYIDFRVNIDSDSKLLIYGHNSRNIDMPFKILENYYSEAYYKEHKYIEIATNSNIRRYEIYSVMVEIKDFSYMKTEFETVDEWYNHIKYFKDKSMYDTGVEINSDDNILILQTCSTHSDYRKYSKKYLLIIGKEI